MTRVAQNMLMNSANLFRKWGEYFEKSFKTHDNERSFASSLTQGIVVPEEEAPSFFHQTVTNIHRNIIVSIRQKDTKLTNLIIFMSIVFFSCRGWMGQSTLLNSTLLALILTMILLFCHHMTLKDFRKVLEIFSDMPAFRTEFNRTP